MERRELRLITLTAGADQRRDCRSRPFEMILESLEAARELRRALYLSPYEAEAHVLLGRIHLRSGRTAEAIQAFKISLWSQDSATGHVALAEAYLKMQNKALAKEEVDRALALDPSSTAARALAETLAGVKPKR